MNSKVPAIILATFVSLNAIGGYEIDSKKNKTISYKIDELKQYNSITKEYRLISQQNLQKILQQKQLLEKQNIANKINMQQNKPKKLPKKVKKQEMSAVLIVKSNVNHKNLTRYNRGYIYNRGSKAVNLSNEDFIALVRVVQGEALDEPFTGKIAVAAVVLNRAKLYDKSVKEIVYSPKQFSCLNNELYNSEELDKDVINACLTALKGVDPTKGATHFLNKKIAKADWAEKFIFTVRIGDHWFYRDEELYKGDVKK